MERRSTRSRLKSTANAFSNDESHEESSEEETTQLKQSNKTNTEPASEHDNDTTNNKFLRASKKMNHDVPIAGPPGLKILLARNETRASAIAEQAVPDKTGKFACPVCNESERQRLDLEVHLRRHFEEYMFACRNCDYQFVSIDAAKEHLKKKACEEDTEDRVAVVSAGATTTSAGTIAKAERKNTRSWALAQEAEKDADGKFSCSLCRHKGICDRGNLEIHLRKIHFKEYVLACHLCQRGFMATSDLNKHVKNKCPKRANGKSGSKRNENYQLNTDTENSRNNDQCSDQNLSAPLDDVIEAQEPAGGKVFDRKTSRAYLASMEAAPDPEARNYFRCPKCTRTTCRTRVELEMHLRKHFNEFACSCSKCGRQFHKTTKLKQHFRSCKSTGSCKATASISGSASDENSFSKEPAIGSASARRSTSYREKFRKRTTDQARYSKRQRDNLQRAQSDTVPVSVSTSQQVNIDPCDEDVTDSNYFECAFCREKLLLKDRASHVQQHKLRGDHFSCKYCDKTFISKFSRIYHERTHTGAAANRCEDCGKEFHIPSSLGRHRRMFCHSRRETSEAAMDLDVSAEEFSSHNGNTAVSSHSEGTLPASRQPLLRKQVQFDRAGAEQMSFRCNLCQRVFTSEANYSKHVQNLLCTVDKIRPESSKHAAENLQSTDKLSECCYCAKKFSNVWNLRGHERLHTGELPYPCTKCSRGYNAMRDLQYHLKKVHGLQIPAEQIKPSILRPRSVKTLELSKSTTKIMSHSAEKRQDKLRYVCDHCDKIFHGKTLYSDHVGEQKTKCSVCGRVFCTDEGYQTHLEDGLCIVGDAVADAEGMFPCGFCDAKFKTNFKKNYHENRHKKLKPYKCDRCRLRFYNPASRQHHRNKVHGLSGLVKDPRCNPASYPCGDNISAGKHRCQFCKKHFNTRAALIVHKRLHTGERPYKCRECDMSFNQAHHAKNHMMRHHSLVASARMAGNKRSVEAKRQELELSTATSTGPTTCRANNVDTENEVHTEPEPNQEIDNGSEEEDMANGPARKRDKRDLFCQHCGKKDFHSSWALTMHERTHTEERLFQCRKCPASFKQSSDARRHMKQCHKLDTAPLRKESAKNHPNQRHKHSKIVHPLRRTVSKYASFNNQKGSHTNMDSTSIKTSNGMYKCSYCRLVFKQLNRKKYHENEHTGAKPYKCDVCHERFPSPVIRSSHRLRIHGLKGAVRAPGCNPFDNPNLSPLIKVNGFFKCNFCDKKFAKSYTVRQHERLHTGEKPYKCRSCDAAFTQSSHARRHMRIRHNLIAAPISDLTNMRSLAVGETENPSHTLAEELQNGTAQSIYFRCPHCEEEFNNNEMFERHVEVVHVKPRPFHCSSCQRGFYSKANYDKHVKNRLCTEDFRPVKRSEYATKSIKEPTSTGLLFECCYCSRQFNNKHHLFAHEQRHMKEASFNCQLCQKGYNVKSDLQTHMMMKHQVQFSDNQKLSSPSKGCDVGKSKSAGLGFEYPCNRCDKAFAENALLAVHIQNVHFEQRPFHCGECQRGFLSEAAYTRHVDNQLCRHRADAEFAAAASLPPQEDDSIEEEPAESSDEKANGDSELKIKLSKYPWAFQILNGPYCYECQECNTKFTKEIIADAHRQWHRDRLTMACIAD